MEKLNEKRLEDICECRPELREELARTSEAWLLSASSGSERTMKRTVLILARYDLKMFKGYKIIMGTPGSRGKSDAVTTWLIEPEELAGVEAVSPKADYILVDKSKLGRPKRTLTEQEQETIRESRDAGETINTIAQKLKVSNRLVMQYVKELKQEAEQ